MTKKTIILYSVAGSAILLTGVTVFALSNTDVYAKGLDFNRSRGNANSSSLVAFNTNNGNTFQNQGQDTTQKSEDCTTDLTQLPMEDLSEDEKSALLYMREEEKLARDVYLTLAEKYNLNVFNNIANSEQKHMDTIKILLDKYNLEDSVTSNEVGQFNNSDLASLYTSLVEQGSVSEIEALKIGATIEDLDIKDLTDDLAKTDNQDITQAFESLRDASYNHLRAFVRNLDNAGGDYSPQYISQAEYDEIIASSNSQGQGGRGNYGQGRGRGG